MMKLWLPHLLQLLAKEKLLSHVHGKQHSGEQCTQLNFYMVRTMLACSWTIHRVKCREIVTHLVLILGVSIESKNLQQSNSPSLAAVIRSVFFDFIRRLEEKLVGSRQSHVDLRACKPDKSELLMHFSIMSMIFSTRNGGIEWGRPRFARCCWSLWQSSRKYVNRCDLYLWSLISNCELWWRDKSRK